MKLLIKNNDEVLRAKDFSTGKIEIYSYYSSNVKLETQLIKTVTEAQFI